jgi:hypothetical protein
VSISYHVITEVGGHLLYWTLPKGI